MEKLSKILTYFLFLCLIIIGLLTYKEIGISWDEPEQREMGLMFYNYIFNNDFNIYENYHQYYGALIEFPLVLIENVFNLESSREIYLSRHLALHLFFIISLFALFKLVYKLFDSYYLAFAAVLIIFLSPRIFAHSFFNSKDTPLMAMFIWSSLAFYNTTKKLNLKNVLILSLLSAMTINIRIVGLLFPILVFFYFLVGFLLEKSQRKLLTKYFFIYFITTILILVAIWPSLWHKPFYTFAYAIYRMGSFPWTNTLLFEGIYLKGNELPWYYLPKTILITTPIYVSLFYFIGLYALISNAIKDKYRMIVDKKARFIVLTALFPIAFILLLIILNSTLYDSWRHVQFLYPFIIILCIYGINEILILVKSKSKTIMYSTKILIFIFIFYQAYEIYKIFPNSQVYYNSLVKSEGNHIRKNYELDYWGASIKQGFEYILINDKSNNIKVKIDLFATKNNLLILEESEKSRLQVSEKFTDEEADYFISFFRWHPYDYQYKNKVFTLKTKGNEYMSVYKLK